MKKNTVFHIDRLGTRFTFSNRKSAEFLAGNILEISMKIKEF